MNDIFWLVFDFVVVQMICNNVFDWFECDDGLGVFGFWVESVNGLECEIDWYQYWCGQLISVEVGLFNICIWYGNWLLLFGCVGWMFLVEFYMVDICGLLWGWGVIISVGLICELFDEFCVVVIFDLLQVLVLCVIEWLFVEMVSLCQQYMIEVLLDELWYVLCQCMYLLMLQDWWLLWIVLQLIVNLVDGCSLEQWVQWVGLLLCILIWYFCDEIIFSFVQWCQQVCLVEGLCCFFDGQGVFDIVYELGFSSFSVFVMVFCCYFGCLFGCYLVCNGQLLNLLCGLVFLVVFG